MSDESNTPEERPPQEEPFEAEPEGGLWSVSGNF